MVYDSFEISFFALDEEKFSIFEYSIYTDLGKFVIDELTSKMKYFSIVKHPNIEGYRYIGSKAEEIECLQFQSMKNVIDDVIIGIRAGDESYFKSDFKATLSTMNILFDIMRTPCQN